MGLPKRSPFKKRRENQGTHPYGGPDLRTGAVGGTPKKNKLKEVSSKRKKKKDFQSLRGRGEAPPSLQSTTHIERPIKRERLGSGAKVWKGVKTAHQESKRASPGYERKCKKRTRVKPIPNHEEVMTYQSRKPSQEKFKNEVN